MMKTKKRVFVSFDELCPYNCKHCYTYGIKREKIRTIEEIIDSISKSEFDVIYVSQKNDNFSNPERGLELCELLNEKYKSHIFIITRNVLNSSEINALKELQIKMARHNKQLFVAISINAKQSIGVCEDVNKTTTPDERILFIKNLFENGFKPILMLRPIFPHNIIPIEECLEIIDLTKEYVSCVVTGGLGINEDILERLNMREDDFTYSQSQEYLQGAIDCEIKFVNVNAEIEKIHNKCLLEKIPVFLHSVPALNYLISE